MYYITESNKGYAIFYKSEHNKNDEYISDNLSLKQARKWCDRLNDALNKGYASGY